MSEDRFNSIERRVSDLSGTVNRVDEKLDDIANSLSSLVRIEERQININEKLSAGVESDRDHEKRLRHIEAEMPGLVEARRWQTLGILGVLALIGEAVMRHLIK